MAEDNLSAPAGPVADAPKSYDEHVEDITSLLEDPDTDLPGGRVKDHAADAEGDDPDVSAEDADEAVADDPDGPDSEVKGGRFAPDSAKVKLEDGTTITVAELKRNNLYQRGFTEKTTALSREKESFEADRRQVTEYAQSLGQFRDYVAAYAEQHLPKQPAAFQGDPMQDPAGYMQWQHQRDQWLQHVEAYQTFQRQKQADEQRKTGETEAQARTRSQREMDALVNAVPTLKDPVKGEALLQAWAKGAAEHYQLTPDELSMVGRAGGHKVYLVLRDALAYRRAKADAPQIEAQVARRPAINGRRVAPNAASNRERQALSERLRQTGSIDDAVAVLTKLNI